MRNYGDAPSNSDMTNAEHIAEIKRLCTEVMEDLTKAVVSIRNEIAGMREDQNAAVDRALDLYLGKRED
jgi:predicted site-specific integrase-resolvase